MIKKHGSAKWSGDLKEGKGLVSTQSGVLSDARYGFNTRFEDGAGTNPEELIGAAHAGCFSMALSGQLAERGLIADQIETTSTIHLSMEGGPKIVKAHLTVSIRAEGDKALIEEAAKAAETGCPVSKVLDCEISMDLTIA
ncbi:OsmC family protein [Celeribacter baekdonensis]|jgi:lipoyl-dependent peroxiredoxin|uniref:Peroxiredoxin n=1 Tax=Celeribacter baekdonensis TaxID=875171 RepID=A0A2R4M389_9RHOB|nr:OsmC family protein [Celeribacter baekdonensis]AVW91598.1 peroxiredoxin [Celeribacter baekdonensis]|tara:strand:- start:40046 stop:40465 length:420 start_codon:yes stop_codon:yes gene_type:complete